MKRTYRISNRFRFIAFVVLSIVLITFIFNFVLGLNLASSLTKPEYINVTISDGETLWHIAETYMSDTKDVRQAVYELCSINDISADDLHTGMNIIIPVHN